MVESRLNLIGKLLSGVGALAFLYAPPSWAQSSNIIADEILPSGTRVILSNDFDVTEAKVELAKKNFANTLSRFENHRLDDKTFIKKMRRSCLTRGAPSIIGLAGAFSFGGRMLEEAAEEYGGDFLGFTSAKLLTAAAGASGEDEPAWLVTWVEDSILSWQSHFSLLTIASTQALGNNLGMASGFIDDVCNYYLANPRERLSRSLSRGGKMPERVQEIRMKAVEHLRVRRVLVNSSAMGIGQGLANILWDFFTDQELKTCYFGYRKGVTELFRRNFENHKEFEQLTDSCNKAFDRWLTREKYSEVVNATLSGAFLGSVLYSAREAISKKLREEVLERIEKELDRAKAMGWFRQNREKIIRLSIRGIRGSRNLLIAGGPGGLAINIAIEGGTFFLYQPLNDHLWDPYMRPMIKRSFYLEDMAGRIQELQAAEATTYTKYQKNNSEPLEIQLRQMAELNSRWSNYLGEAKNQIQVRWEKLLQSFLPMWDGSYAFYKTMVNKGDHQLLAPNIKSINELLDPDLLGRVRQLLARGEQAPLIMSTNDIGLSQRVLSRAQAVGSQAALLNLIDREQPVLETRALGLAAYVEQFLAEQDKLDALVANLRSVQDVFEKYAQVIEANPDGVCVVLGLPVGSCTNNPLLDAATPLTIVKKAIGQLEDETFFEQWHLVHKGLENTSKQNANFFKRRQWVSETLLNQIILLTSALSLDSYFALDPFYIHGQDQQAPFDPAQMASCANERAHLPINISDASSSKLACLDNPTKLRQGGPADTPLFQALAQFGYPFKMQSTTQELVDQLVLTSDGSLYETNTPLNTFATGLEGAFGSTGIKVKPRPVDHLTMRFLCGHLTSESIPIFDSNLGPFFEGARPFFNSPGFGTLAPPSVFPYIAKNEIVDKVCTSTRLATPYLEKSFYDPEEFSLAKTDFDAYKQTRLEFLSRVAFPQLTAERIEGLVQQKFNGQPPMGYHLRTAVPDSVTGGYFDDILQLASRRVPLEFLFDQGAFEQFWRDNVYDPGREYLIQLADRYKKSIQEDLSQKIWGAESAITESFSEAAIQLWHLGRMGLSYPVKDLYNSLIKDEQPKAQIDPRAVELFAVQMRAIKKGKRYYSRTQPLDVAKLLSLWMPQNFRSPPNLGQQSKVEPLSIEAAYLYANSVLASPLDSFMVGKTADSEAEFDMGMHSSDLAAYRTYARVLWASHLESKDSTKLSLYSPDSLSLAYKLMRLDYLITLAYEMIDTTKCSVSQKFHHDDCHSQTQMISEKLIQFTMGLLSIPEYQQLFAQIITASAKAKKPEGIHDPAQALEAISGLVERYQITRGRGIGELHVRFEKLSEQQKKLVTDNSTLKNPELPEPYDTRSYTASYDFDHRLYGLAMDLLRIHTSLEVYRLASEWGVTTHPQEALQNSGRYRGQQGHKALSQKDALALYNAKLVNKSVGLEFLNVYRSLIVNILDKSGWNLTLNERQLLDDDIDEVLLAQKPLFEVINDLLTLTNQSVSGFDSYLDQYLALTCKEREVLDQVYRKRTHLAQSVDCNQVPLDNDAIERFRDFK